MPHKPRRCDLYADKARRLLCYDPETGVVTRRVASSNAPAGAIATFRSSNGYLRVCVGGIEYRAHRVIWLMQTGRWPADEIDHVNRNGRDNRWCNLREAVPSQQQGNRSQAKNNTSGYRGVTFFTRVGKWQARIMIAGKLKHLGLFHSIEDAAAAYHQAAQRKWGDRYSPAEGGSNAP